MKYQIYKEKKFSKIGLGIARYGTVVPEDTAEEILDKFTDFFYEGALIDTARNYYEWAENGRGKSESCLGKWLVKSGRRQTVCICTKGGLKGKGQEAVRDLSRNNLTEDIKESLDALQSDYIDIYLLHKDDLKREVDEIVNTMQYVKEIGKVGMIGVSNWSCDRIKAANQYAVSHGLEPFSIVQTWWSLAEYKKEMWNDETTTCMNDDLYRYMLNENMLGMAYTSQCKGYFQKAIQYGREQLDSFLRHRIETEANIKKTRYIQNICEMKQCTPTDVVLGYITNNRLPGIALASCSGMEHLTDLLASAEFELAQENINALDHIR